MKDPKAWETASRLYLSGQVRILLILHLHHHSHRNNSTELKVLCLPPFRVWAICNPPPL
jgi:hypothetical protein